MAQWMSADMNVEARPLAESKPNWKSVFMKLDRAPSYANRGGRGVWVEMLASGSVTGN